MIMNGGTITFYALSKTNLLNHNNISYTTETFATTIKSGINLRIGICILIRSLRTDLGI